MKGIKTIMIVMVKREVCGPSRSGDDSDDSDVSDDSDDSDSDDSDSDDSDEHEVCGPSGSGDNLVARHGGDTGTPLTLPLTRAARDQESLEAGLQRHTRIEAHRVLEKVGKCQKISWNS